jgi:hypothetical protein
MEEENLVLTPETFRRAILDAAQAGRESAFNDLHSKLLTVMPKSGDSVTVFNLNDQFFCWNVDDLFAINVGS